MKCNAAETHNSAAEQRLLLTVALCSHSISSAFSNFCLGMPRVEIISNWSCFWKFAAEAEIDAEQR